MLSASEWRSSSYRSGLTAFGGHSLDLLVPLKSLHGVFSFNPKMWRILPLTGHPSATTPSYLSWSLLATTRDGSSTTVENLFHIKATLSFHQTHRAFYSQPSWMLWTPPVFTFLFSLHVFSCLRTICPITVVMWLTHPASFLFLRLFWPLTQLHPSWLVIQ